MIPNAAREFNFGLGETAEAIRDSVRSFAQEKIAPRAEDETAKAPDWTTTSARISETRSRSSRVCTSSARVTTQETIEAQK